MTVVGAIYNNETSKDSTQCSYFNISLNYLIKDAPTEVTFPQATPSRTRSIFTKILVSFGITPKTK